MESTRFQQQTHGLPFTSLAHYAVQPFQGISSLENGEISDPNSNDEDYNLPPIEEILASSMSIQLQSRPLVIDLTGDSEDDESPSLSLTSGPPTTPLPPIHTAQRAPSSGSSLTRSESPEAGISLPALPFCPTSFTSSYSTTHRCSKQAAQHDHVLTPHASPLKKSPFKSRPHWAIRRSDSADTTAVLAETPSTSTQASIETHRASTAVRINEVNEIPESPISAAGRASESRPPCPGSPKMATSAGNFCRDFLFVANLLGVTFIKVVGKRDGLVGHEYQFELRSPWLSAESAGASKATHVHIQEYEKSEARDTRLASLRKRKSSQISSSAPAIPSQPKPAKKPKVAHAQAYEHSGIRPSSSSPAEVNARSETEAANSDSERESSRLPSHQVEPSLSRVPDSCLASVDLEPIALPCP